MGMNLDTGELMAVKIIDIVVSSLSMDSTDSCFSHGGSSSSTNDGGDSGAYSGGSSSSSSGGGGGGSGGGSSSASLTTSQRAAKELAALEHEVGVRKWNKQITNLKSMVGLQSDMCWSIFFWCMLAWRDFVCIFEF
jgi:hypothetical protein